MSVPTAMDVARAREARRDRPTDDVTAATLGDPEPGRSALDRRPPQIQVDEEFDD